MSEKMSDGCERRLVDGEPRQVGLRWPVEVDDLLVALVRRANDVGANTSRKEVMAALLVHAREAKAEELRDQVVAYRQARVADVRPLANEQAVNRG